MADEPAKPGVAVGLLKMTLATVLFSGLGFAFLEFYAARLDWPVAYDWYHVDERGDEARFRCQNFAPSRFSVAPAPGVRRVLVLGGSTAFGYPERPLGEEDIDASRYGFVGAMQTSLDAAAPGGFELINLGVNGGTSADSRRLLRRYGTWGADALIVYDGNNEYMTAPQSFSAALWGSALIRRFAALQEHAREAPGRVGPSAYGGPEHSAAIQRELRRNLEAIADLAEDAGIPALFATQAVNLSGFDPNWSTAGDGEALSRLDGLGDSDVEALWSATPDSAEAAWAVGQRRLGEARDAKPALQAAVDRDGLPFRATSAINGIIEEVALARGLTLIDSEAAVQVGARLPGEADFYDWIHPRPAAAQRLAAAMLDGLERAGVLPDGAPADVLIPALTDEELLEAELREARSWLQWACVRWYAPTFRLARARVYAESVLERAPDHPEAQAILSLADALTDPAAATSLPTDPEIRGRLASLHPRLAALLP